LAGESGGDRMWGLRELPLPETIPWLPQTPGWFVLTALALGFLAWLGLRGYRAWRAEDYRRHALARLAEMERHRDELQALPGLLRSTALAAFPREEVAGIRGSDWIDWLNAAGAEFAPEDARWLDQLAYQPDSREEVAPESVARLLSASRAFVRSHRARL